MKNQPRAWVRQPSGRRLDLLNPTPFDWDDKDLAIGMARTFRWAGHSIWPHPMSIAQHSLLVLELRRRASDEPLPSPLALRELLHDGEEALIGFDCVSPMKPILGDGFTELSDRLIRAIFTRYAIPWWTPEEHALHKHADVLAAASEAVHVAGWSTDDVREVLGIRIKPLAATDDPLIKIYGGNPWEPWPATVSAERFLDALQSLG